MTFQILIGNCNFVQFKHLMFLLQWLNICSQFMSRQLLLTDFFSRTQHGSSDYMVSCDSLVYWCLVATKHICIMFECFANDPIVILFMLSFQVYLFGLGAGEPFSSRCRSGINRSGCSHSLGSWCKAQILGMTHVPLGRVYPPKCTQESVKTGNT